MNANVPEPLKQFVSRFVTSKDDEWWVRDLRNSYKWLKNAVVYWVIDSKTDTSIMVLKRSTQPYARLNCLDGLPIISNVIREDLGVVPSNDFSTYDFARLLMHWYHEPRGYIATPAFFEKKQRELSDWLMGEEKDPTALRNICRTPVYTRSEADSWSLLFNMINHKGGVEEWVARGRLREFEIQSISIKMVRENGTFYYPDEL